LYLKIFILTSIAGGFLSLKLQIKHSGTKNTAALHCFIFKNKLCRFFFLIYGKHDKQLFTNLCAIIF